MTKLIKSTFTKLTAAAALAVVGLAGANQINTQSNNTNAVEAATQKIAKINYVPGYGIAVWSTPESPSPTGQYLPHGSRWKVIKTVVNSKGETWYDLGANQWIKAQYTVDGSQVTQSTNASSKVQAVINLAKKQMGKPYVWGGKGPSGFDCSGLMYYVFANAAGKNIGGWTVPQESAGRQVSTSQLQAGDLVFWGARGNTYHVGLYLGNNQYIHAPQPGQGVQIASISSYFKPSFGVRVF